MCMSLASARQENIVSALMFETLDRNIGTYPGKDRIFTMKHPARKIGALACAVWFGAALLFAADGDKGGGKAIDDYNFAVWLYNSGKYDLAAESYAAFLKNYPDYERAPDARFGLAQALFHTDKFEQAAKEYEKVRADRPDFSQAAELLFQLGQAYVALNRFAEAAPLFAQLREKHAAHYLADWAMARQAACLISLGKNQEAEGLLKQFADKYAADDSAGRKEMLQKLDKAGIKAGPAFMSLVERSLFNLAFAQFNQERFADAQKTFENFLSKYPKSDLQEEAYFRLAQSLYRQAAYSKAAEAYKEVSGGAGPFAEPAGYERGLSLYKAGDLKGASVAFEKVAGRFPQGAQTPKARLYSGTTLFEAGDYNGAMERLEPLAMARKEQADEAAYWVAMSQLKLNKAAEAARGFADAIRDFPQSAKAGEMRLGLADARLAQNDFVAATEAFRDFAAKFEKSPQAPRALYSACAALHRADKYPESDDLCGEFIGKFDKSEFLSQVLFLSGENRFLRKKYDQAAERYTAYLQLGEKAPDRAARAHYRLAWVHRYAKRNKEALEELQKIDAKSAGDVIAAEMKYLEGVCLFETGKFAPAIKALGAYLDAPDHGRFGDDALLKMAVAETRQDNKTKSAAHLERFLKEYPKSDLLAQVQYQLAESYYDQKTYGKAIEKYGLVAEREKTDELTPFAMFGIGLCHYDQEQWEKAAQAFGRVAEKYPKNDLTPQALYRKARSLVKLKKWAEAEQAAGALLAAYPKHELARSTWMTIGICRQEQQKWTEAAAAYKTIDEDFPAGDDRARILYEQAWSWRQAGKEAESLAAFRKLAEKCPKDPLVADACFYLAEAKYKISPEASASETPKQRSERVVEALDLYRKVLENAADKRLADKARFRVGWCCWLLEQYPKAAEEFDRLVKEFPESELFADALFQAGQSHAKAGQSGTAVERFNRLIGDRRAASFEFLPDAHLALANCLIILDKHAEAVEPLETLLGKYKEDRVQAQGCFLLGKARFNLKKYDDALQSFQEVTARTKTEIGAEAQFYIGQIAQARNDFKSATVAYLRVIALYREHREWVAAAMYESAKCYEALGDKSQAGKTRAELLSGYGDTKWAKLAAERRSGE